MLGEWVLASLYVTSSRQFVQVRPALCLKPIPTLRAHQPESAVSEDSWNAGDIVCHAFMPGMYVRCRLDLQFSLSAVETCHGSPSPSYQDIRKMTPAVPAGIGAVTRDLLEVGRRSLDLKLPVPPI